MIIIIIIIIVEDFANIVVNKRNTTIPIFLIISNYNLTQIKSK